jgi:hypothetical protein
MYQNSKATALYSWPQSYVLKQCQNQDKRTRDDGRARTKFPFSQSLFLLTDQTLWHHNTSTSWQQTTHLRICTKVLSGAKTWITSKRSTAINSCSWPRPSYLCGWSYSSTRITSWRATSKPLTALERDHNIHTGIHVCTAPLEDE